MQKRLLVIIFSCLLVYGLWWKWQLAVSRYFDIDEFAYLHWAYNAFSGKKPYLDFFYFLPPGYIWFLAPFYAIGPGITPLIAARVSAWVIFSLICICTGILFWQTKKSLWGAVASAAILAFLPMPSDKFIEVRPDNLAQLLSLIGLICQIGWMRSRKKWLGFVSGLVYGLALMVLPKAAPNVLVGLVIVLMSAVGSRFILLGLVLPFAGFSIWAMGQGSAQFEYIFYTLTKLPFEVNKFAVFGGVMRPDLYFYPNPVYYGQAGISSGLIANHLIWLIGLFWGTYRLVRSLTLIELLIPASLMIQVFAYVYFYPLRHTQYLIPIAVFVAFYAADLLVFLKGKLGNLGRLGYLGILIILSWGLVVISHRVNYAKVMTTNQAQLGLMQSVWQNVSKTEKILDLSGQTIYYPDAYFACCIPFGQFGQFLTRPLPDLISALDQKKVRYLFLSNRFNTLPLKESAYINSNYQETTIPGLYERQ